MELVDGADAAGAAAGVLEDFSPLEGVFSPVDAELDEDSESFSEDGSEVLAA